jgi:hypothetical protein
LVFCLKEFLSGSVAVMAGISRSALQPGFLLKTKMEPNYANQDGFVMNVDYKAYSMRPNVV